MRLVQISVPQAQQSTIIGVLREHHLGYTVVESGEEQADQALIQFVVPADAVEHVLADLEGAGFDRHTYTVSLKAEFAEFEDIDVVQNHWANTPNRLAPAALRSKAKDLRLNTRSFVWMMVLSAIVATAGLLLSSPAVVVGSMVIAPIVSPVLTASVGAVRNDRDMFIHSIHLQGIGLAVAIVTATAFSWLITSLNIVPTALATEQMELVSLRLSPSILAIAIGLAAGAAGAYGLATKGQVTIVGVMIAAALIPTAAAVGIGLAWRNAVVTLGALLLLVLSMIAINIGGSLMLYYLDYRPDQVDDSLLTFNNTTQLLVVGFTLLVVVGTVVTVGGMFYQQSSFERSVNDAVTDVLRQERYQSLAVMSITIEYIAPALSEQTLVTITLARTSDREFASLPAVFDDTITTRTSHDVIVQVQFVDYERSDDPELRGNLRDGVTELPARQMGSHGLD